MFINFTTHFEKKLAGRHCFFAPNLHKKQNVDKGCLPFSIKALSIIDISFHPTLSILADTTSIASQGATDPVVSSTDSATTAGIIGGVVGGIVLIVLVAVVIAVVIKRRQQ